MRAAALGGSARRLVAHPRVALTGRGAAAEAHTQARPLPRTPLAPAAATQQLLPPSLARGLGGAAGSRRGLATLLVDGGSPSSTVLEDLARVSAHGQDGAEILAVGQKGIVVALDMLAQLGAGEDLRPTFTLARTTEEKVQEHAPRADFTADGSNHYRLALPAKREWETAAARRDRVMHDPRMLVGNKTEVMKLAKAIAARTKEMPEGRYLAVETSLRGSRAPSRLRVSRLAHAVARAYQWQVAPLDASRPVRTFRCAVSLVEGDAAEQGQQEIAGGQFLRMEVLPDGPQWGSIPGS